MAKKTTVSTLNIAITATAKGLRAGLTKANQSLRGLGAGAKRTAGSITSSFASAKNSILKLLKPLAVVAAILAVVIANLNKVSTAFEDAALTAERLGLASGELIALRSEAERAGASANTLDMGLQRMTRRISQAAQGSGEAVAALKELGLSASKLATLSTADQMQAIAKAMDNVKNRGDRTRLMFALFDSEGVALDKTLKNLAANGMGDIVERAKELGLLLSDVDLANLQDFKEASNELKDAWTGLTNQIAAFTAPAITALFQGLSDAIQSVTGSVRELRISFHLLAGATEEEALSAVNQISSVGMELGKAAKAAQQVFGIKAPEETAASTFAADLKAAEEAAKAAATAAKAMADDIAKITEKFRTPLEVLKDRIAEIKRLMAGGLSPEVGTRAIDKALKDFKELERIKGKLTIRPVGAAVKGTTAGFAAVQGGQDRLKELAIHAKRKEASDKRMEELLKDILEELEKPVEVVDVTEVDIV